MKNMLKYFIIAASLCMLSASVYGAAISNGHVRIEGKEVTAGTSFTVQVWFEGNSQAVTSLRIPLKYDAEYLTCNYVDFSGSLLIGGMQSVYFVESGGVELSYVPPVVNPLPAITSVSGLVATLYFTVSSDAPTGVLALDTLFNDDQFEQLGTIFHQWTRLEMTNGDGINRLEATFTPGLLTVLRPTDVAGDDGLLIPEKFVLNQNYPNPFNPSTTISFALPEKRRIRLEIFNVLGQTIEVLADGDFPAGWHEIEWRAEAVPSGIYFYRIKADSKSFTKKMLLMK